MKHNGDEFICLICSGRFDPRYHSGRKSVCGDCAARARGDLPRHYYRDYPDALSPNLMHWICLCALRVFERLMNKIEDKDAS